MVALAEGDAGALSLMESFFAGTSGNIGEAALLAMAYLLHGELALAQRTAIRAVESTELGYGYTLHRVAPPAVAVLCALAGDASGVEKAVNLHRAPRVLWDRLIEFAKQRASTQAGPPQ